MKDLQYLGIHDSVIQRWIIQSTGSISKRHICASTQHLSPRFSIQRLLDCSPCNPTSNCLAWSILIYYMRGTLFADATRESTDVVHLNISIDFSPEQIFISASTSESLSCFPYLRSVAVRGDISRASCDNYEVYQILGIIAQPSHFEDTDGGARLTLDILSYLADAAHPRLQQLELCKCGS